MKTSFVVLLVLSLVLLTFTQIEVVTADSKTVVVPDDYSTIQAAIDNAADGDTVFVKNGIYHVDENTLIVIDKTLSLIGEDSENTVIFGLFSNHSSGSTPAIRVAAPNVTISGFTITNCRTGIAIANYYAEPFPSGCRIVDNNIVNNGEGIRSQRSDLFVSGNNITGNQGGIMGWNTQNIIVTGNNIAENAYGINIGISRNITVSGNNISNNSRGLNLVYYGPYFVYGNNITKNDWGIRFAEGCNNATVNGNNISQNNVGVVLLNFPNGGDVAVSGVGNKVFGNFFIGNSEQVLPNEVEFENIRMGSNGTDIVLWDNSTIGNYWDDYTGLDENDDEIGDTPYIIDEYNQDNYPLMNPVDITTIPEFPSWLILPLIFAATLSVIVFKKNLYR